jgi:hypothetical protein
VTSASEYEPLSALPVLAPAARPVNGARPGGSAVGASGHASIGALPAVQAAAVAAGGFVAGAAVVRLAHRHRARALAAAKPRALARVRRRHVRGRNAPSRAVTVLDIVASRSLLVDVHLLGGRD